MVSIIVSSRNSENNELVKGRISRIGVEFELIYFVNNNSTPLTEVYNQLLKKCKYNFICFMHDDLIIETMNWGQILINKIGDDDRLIGLAGSKIFTGMPIGWTSGINEIDFCFVNHKNDNFKNPENIFERVKIIDGVFLFTTRRIVEEIKFSNEIKGFHFYDIDFSYRVSLKFPVFVTSSLQCIHDSKGNFNTSWVKASIIFSRRFKHIRPLIQKQFISEIRLFWYSRLKNEQISLLFRILYVFNLGIEIKCWKSAVKFIFKIK